MPYPSQINRDTLILKAIEMVEVEGYEALSLAKLAGALGIKAPSLYNHVKSKTELLREINLYTMACLTTAMQEAAERADGDAAARVYALAVGYRIYAHAHPVLYDLAFTATVPGLHPEVAALEALALPLQDVMAALVGEDDALPALRGAWALLHGYVMLELTQNFRRGGDLDVVFDRVVRAYLAGWR